MATVNPPPRVSQPRVSVQRSVAICLLYAGTSMTISMTNKLLLSQYAFGGTFILLGCQLFGALCFVTLFKICHKANFMVDYIPAVPDLEWEKYKKSLLVASLFVANVGSAFFGLRVVDVPMFLCVRRLTTVCVMISEYFLLQKVASPQIRVAVALIMGGTLLAGYETLSSNFMGYVFVMSNNVLTAVLYVYQKKFCDETGLKSFGLLYYNAVTALPLSLFVAFVLGEFDALKTFPYLHDAGFQSGMVMSSVLGVLMTYAIVLCNMVNSPLATSVTGNAKDILSTFVGWALFGGFLATFSSVTGLMVSFIGAGYYSFLKLQSAMVARTAAKSPAPSADEEDDGTEAEEGEGLMPKRQQRE